jgi:hypothetical protein
MKKIKMPKLVQGICKGCEVMDEYLVDQYGVITPCRNCDPSSELYEVIVVRGA